MCNYDGSMGLFHEDEVYPACPQGMVLYIIRHNTTKPMNAVTTPRIKMLDSVDIVTSWSFVSNLVVFVAIIYSRFAREMNKYNINDFSETNRHCCLIFILQRHQLLCWRPTYRLPTQLPV